MKAGQTLWTRDELIIAINLYCKLPFGKMHRGNPDVKFFANLIGRSPSAMAYKLVNFASLDPSLKERGIRGAGHRGSLDKIIWDEFYGNWEEALNMSEHLIAERQHTTVEQLNHISMDDLPKEGKEKQRLVKTRVTQSIFRTIVMATYNSRCCITGINNPALLIASHLVPWSQDEKNRMNPMNGLALNALHDKAFDAGLITIDANDYTLRLSSKLKAKDTPDSIKQNFWNYEGKEILLPDKFLPDREFLRVHGDTVYQV